MKRLMVALSVALLAAACDVGTTIEDINEAAEGPTPVTTAAPWPSRFEDHLCVAVEQFGHVEPDLITLLQAAEDHDPKGVVRFANAASANVESMDEHLELIASDYQPARAMLVAWRRANRVLVDALDLVDRGATNLSISTLGRANERMRDALVLLDKISPLIDSFEQTTGFACPEGP